MKMMSMVAVLFLFAWWFVGCASGPDGKVPDEDAPGITSRDLGGGFKVHALRVGWVRIKSVHRELRGPNVARFARVIADGQWYDWMPIIVYAIEHPGGVILVDTGPDPQINDEGYFDCDPDSAFFYNRNLRFHLGGERERLTSRLAAVGITPEQIDTIVITHFHADHVGNIDLMPAARVLTGEGNWPEHVGLVGCVLPDGFAPEQIPMTGPPVGGFSGAHALGGVGKDREGSEAPARVHVVQLPGHTPGHVGVWIEGSEHAPPLLIAGDATFDLEQTSRAAVSGVSEDVGVARQTQRDIGALDAALVLPAHDPSVFERLSP